MRSRPALKTSANGIEVVKIALNQQPDQDAQTQQFIDAFRFKIDDDSTKLFHNQFFPDFAITTFAAINELDDSRSYQQWEIIATRENLRRSEDAVIDLHKKPSTRSKAQH
ncbi:MAG: hypothetical protein M2R45_02229 [Verrucomicrobia subdivision 3 bacterium]|nr:hypothetical protein [Limisphaerales bacterium]MCS1413986.1 hypothetical protein [Limisphaerales bacterium]